MSPVIVTVPDDLAAISAARVTAIGEARRRIVAGDRGADLLDLIQHMRELLELFTQGLGQMGDDPRARVARGMVDAFRARLGAIERDAVDAPLH